MNYILANVEHVTTEGKIRALKEILPVIAGIDDEVTLNEYIKRIASALVLDEVRVDEEWKAFSAKGKVVARSNILDKPKTTIQEASEIVLKMAWQESETLGYIFALVPREIFNQVHREIIDWIENCAMQDRRPDSMSAAKELSEEANAELSRILMEDTIYLGDDEVFAFEDSVKILRRAALQEKYHQLMEQSEKYPVKDDATYNGMVRESLKIKKEIDKLKANANCF